MDRVQDTSKYHPTPLVSMFMVKVIHGHEVKKDQAENVGFGGVIHVLGYFSPRTRINHPRTFVYLFTWPTLDTHASDNVFRLNSVYFFGKFEYIP